jgi:hypothetical protein
VSAYSSLCVAGRHGAARRDPMRRHTLRARPASHSTSFVVIVVVIVIMT